MTDETGVAAHYGQHGLLAAIEAAVQVSGKTTDTVSVDDLAPADEFHIGGRVASEAFLGQLGHGGGDRVLDVGCGLGGTARFAAQSYGCRVVGVDLTEEFVSAGRAMTAWVGLAEQVDLRHGSALNLEFEPDQFDAAYMLHVGMNVADKARLFAEVLRVLRPGAVYGVYDIMATSSEALDYPVPWATTAATSALAGQDTYRRLLEDAGFEIVGERNRREFAVAFFDDMRRRMQAAGSPPPLGLHIVMGPEAAVKVQNMIANIAAGRIAPVEIIARKP